MFFFLQYILHTEIHVCYIAIFITLLNLKCLNNLNCKLLFENEVLDYLNALCSHWISIVYYLIFAISRNVFILYLIGRL